MDIVSIVDLDVYAHHGVHPEEQAMGQKFLITADLFVDTKKAGATDNIEDSLDYGVVAHFIDRFMWENTYKLIEAVAEHLAENLLDRFDQLQGVHLTVKKPWAPVGLPLNYVSVDITRMRDE